MLFVSGGSREGVWPRGFQSTWKLIISYQNEWLFIVYMILV